MSGLDDNPFGEPTVDNPFADPAVKQVTNNRNAQIKVEEYNPFENQYSRPGASEPAVMQPTQDPPVYTRSAQQQVQPKPMLDTAELQRKQEELQRKEEELARREAEMMENPYNVRRNNWPPLPEQCCFQPCFYQDIQVEIPLEFQKIVRRLYYLWLFHGALMIVNVIGGIILLDFTIIGLGVVFMLLFTPASYLCWFRPAYKAFKSDSSFNYMVFFFVFFFQFVITTVQAIGIPSSGTIGIIVALEQFGEEGATAIVKGVFALIIASGFALAAVGDIYLISRIHRIYRSSSASFAKAQMEFTSEFLKNPHVRDAAANVATATVQSQFSQNTNRY